MRGVKPRKSCFAVSMSLHASLNVQPVIHHLATNRETNSNSNKIQQLLEKNNTLCKGRMLKSGQVQNLGRVDSFTHRENHQFYYVVSNKFVFIVVAFCVCLIESLPVSLSALGRDV